MSNFRFAITTRFALITALGFAALMASSLAAAGTQYPKSNWYKMQARLAAMNDAAQSQAQAVVDNGSETDYENGDDKKTDTPDYTDNGSSGGDEGHGGNPQAVPSPSAVAGGLAMIGLLAGRRRRQAQDA